MGTKQFISAGSPEEASRRFAQCIGISVRYATSEEVEKSDQARLATLRKNDATRAEYRRREEAYRAPHTPDNF